MPYDKTSGLMTEPLNIYDIAIATGMPSYASVGDCAAYGRVNKWAKNKFIVWDKLSDLLPEERIGRQREIEQGYYYGVKLGSHSGYGGDIIGLHDVRFVYLRPYDYFRANDFIGYSSKAEASVFCDIPDSGYNDTEMGLEFQIRYNPLNTLGIDVSEAVLRATGNTITNCYPFVLLSNVARTQHYACALKTETGVVSTISERNTKYYASLEDVGGSRLPAGDYIITPFLYKPTGSDASYILVSGAWFVVSSAFDRPITHTPIVIPNNYYVDDQHMDAGKRITVGASDNRPRMRIDTITFDGTEMTIRAVVDGGWDGNYFQCRCTPKVQGDNWSAPGSPKVTGERDGAVAYRYDMQADFDIVKGVPATYTLECLFEVLSASAAPKQSFDNKTFTY